MFKEMVMERFKSYPIDFLTDNRVHLADLVDYYDGHYQRFEAGYNLFEEFNFKQPIKVYELGTPFPYWSYPYAVKYGWDVEYMDIVLQHDYRFEEAKIYGHHGNMHTDDFGTEKYDLVICSEVLEHLASNLIETRDRIIKAVKPNGHLIITYPIGYIGNDPALWDRELSYDGFDPSTHKREFREDTYPQFMPFPIIRAIPTSTRLYWRMIVCLYQKVV